MTEIPSVNGKIDLTIDEKEAIAGKYTVMPRISTLEKECLTVSLLQPQTVMLDVPTHKAQLQNPPTLLNEQPPNDLFNIEVSNQICIHCCSCNFNSISSI